MKNDDIRMYAKKKGVYMWEVAAALGVSDMTLIRRLRKDLSNETRNRITQAIESAALKKREVV